MPVPLVVIGAGAIARAVAVAAAKQAAKQGVKKLTATQTRKIVREQAAKRGINKVSNIQARRIAEQAAGPKARRLGGEAGLRANAPKPDVRITTKSGKYRGYGTLSKEKTTVTKPVRRETNKKGSAITIRKTVPRKASDVRAEAQKVRRDRLREALTPRVNPARPKVTPKRGTDSSSKSSAREQEIIDRYYRIRFGDRGGPTPRSAQGKQGSIESRIASGSEKPTRGSINTTGDKEATVLAQRSMRALNSPKAAAKERVTPGKATKTTIALRTVGGTRGAQAAKLKGTIRNQRKVLREREIKETAERMRKAEEAAKKRGTK